MKTPEEWFSNARMDCASIFNLIKEVQADALESAAKVCETNAGQYNVECGRWEKAAAEKCARFIRALIAKETT